MSPATVSRVLNGHPGVDATLAERVRMAVGQLAYRPSRAARTMRTHRAAVWGLVISDIRNPFFTDMARGVEDRALETGYSVVLCNTDESRPKERAYLNLVLDERMAGVIIAPASGGGTDIEPLVAANIPIVLVDRTTDLGVDSVVIDNHAGARMAVEHLLAQGYTRIACITGPVTTTTGRDRALGYVAALGSAGLPVDEQLLVYADFRYDGGYAAATSLLAMPEPPDSMFVANNLMTVGALAAIRHAGRRVPGDVGVVAFDDLPLAELLDPPLTTIGQPTYEIGEQAARLLLDRLAGCDDPARHIVLTPTLRVRGSSAGPS